MWAVSRFETDHGLDASLPLAATCYRYEDAMLDQLGRGFQGFKKIVAEEQTPALPPGAAAPPASFDAANDLRSVQLARGGLRG